MHSERIGRFPKRRDASNSACLPKGPIVAPGTLSRVPRFPAYHACSPIALMRFLVCFCSGKAF